MRTIIELLRKTDDRDSQFIYSYIRNNVVAINGEIDLKTKRPVHSIRDEYQYIEFKNEFIKPKYKNKYDIIDEKVDNLFEKIDGPYTLVYCAYCGSKMYKSKEDYVCIGRSICKNNLNPGEEQTVFRNIPIGESIYIPKRGVSRYNNIYIDKISGKSRNKREELELMLNELEIGDELYIHEISRLARSIIDLKQI